MYRKRSLIRVLTRLMYVGGFILLISGLLLSAMNSPAMAAQGSVSGENFSNQAMQETPYPSCPGCEPPVEPAVTSESPSSSLVFSSGCHCSCENVFATVCNVGGADMSQAVDWQLYFSQSGNPSFGQVVDSGTLGPLAAGECTTLAYPPSSSGSYAYRLEQEPDGSGQTILWSNACMVSGACFAATATSTPFQPDTATPTGEPTDDLNGEPTATGTAPAIELTLTPTDDPNGEPTATVPPGPTATATTQSTPLPFNLSFVCGYAGDDYLLWWVSNRTSEAADYTWRVSGSEESGSGSVDANSVAYFTTSTGDKTVHLFIDGERVDSAVSDGPCKEYLTLSYACTVDGLVWYANNPNSFGVDYSWSIDGVEGGRGMLPANSSVALTTTSDAVHTLELTWTDTRPGTHTVGLTSSGDPCDLPPTATATLDPPPLEISLTPTITNTPQPPVNTSTPTPTNTSQPPVFTNTPTATNTSQPPAFTNTPTATNTQQPPVFTNTPTATNTPQPPVFVTATNSPVPPFIVITNTPTNTPLPPIVVTATNIPTVPVIVITNTPQPPVFVTATNLPIVQVTVITNTPQPPMVVTATGEATVQVIVITNTPTNTLLPPVATPTLITPELLQINTATATQIVTLPPPAATITRTPVLIPVTGADSTNYGSAMRLSLLGGLLTNAGLVILGLALAMTGIQTQIKQR